MKVQSIFKIFTMLTHVTVQFSPCPPCNAFSRIFRLLFLLLCRNPLDCVCASYRSCMNESTGRFLMNETLCWHDSVRNKAGKVFRLHKIALYSMLTRMRLWRRLFRKELNRTCSTVSLIIKSKSTTFTYNHYVHFNKRTVLAWMDTQVEIILQKDLEVKVSIYQ